METKRAFNSDGEDYVGGVEIKSETTGRITAVYATLNCVDRDGDVTVPHAFTNGAPVMISDWNHSSWQGAKPVGKGVIYEDGDQAILEGQFFMGTTHGRDAFETVKELGELASFSYGFDVIDSVKAPSNSTYGPEHRRTLRRMTVHEVSPVIVPAGINTRLLSVKSDRDTRDTLYSRHTPSYTLDNRTRLELEAYRVQLARFERDEHQKLVDLARRFKDDLARAALAEELKGLAVTAGALYGYRMVREADVPAETRRAVKDAVLKRDPRVTIGWFVSEPDPKRVEFTDPVAMGGYCFPSAAPERIWIRADVDADQAHGFAHHELAHLLDGAHEEQAQLAGIRATLEHRGEL
ncbi:HK97 family phage prohead protease [Streptomyces sp. NPDC047043]|uniref:HK97 family phage prohead protease n=1 Tax=Streptomyces sp. NPDC047043 TaxID=3154497 RepID=UPI0033C4C5C3